MIFPKACPKCKGTMDLSRDDNGAFKRCLSCGYELNIAEDISKPKSAVTLSRFIDMNSREIVHVA